MLFGANLDKQSTIVNFIANSNNIVMGMAALVRQTYRTNSIHWAVLRRAPLGRGNRTRRCIGSLRGLSWFRDSRRHGCWLQRDRYISISTMALRRRCGRAFTAVTRALLSFEEAGRSGGSTAGRCRCGLAGACMKQFWKVGKVFNGEYGLATLVTFIPGTDRRRGANRGRDSVLPPLR